MDAVRGFVEREEWPSQIDEERGLVRMRFRGTSGEWNVAVQVVGADHGKVVVYSLPGPPVPEGRRLDVNEAVARLNWGMVLGNFELDLDGGGVRYRTSADFRGGQPTPDLIGHLVFTNVLMMDRYLPAIEAVAWQGRDPGDAVAEVEARRLAEEAEAAEDAEDAGDAGDAEDAGDAGGDEE